MKTWFRLPLLGLLLLLGGCVQYRGYIDPVSGQFIATEYRPFGSDGAYIPINPEASFVEEGLVEVVPDGMILSADGLYYEYWVGGVVVRRTDRPRYFFEHAPHHRFDGGHPGFAGGQHHFAGGGYGHQGGGGFLHQGSTPPPGGGWRGGGGGWNGGHASGGHPTFGGGFHQGGGGVRQPPQQQHHR